MPKVEEITMKCSWCQKEIISSPYIEKKWTAIAESELYHSHCFMVAHKGLMDNIPNDIPQPPTRQSIESSVVFKESLGNI
jgi:hypothetical protein